MTTKFQTLLIGTGVSSLLLGVVLQMAIRTKNFELLFYAFPPILVMSYVVVPRFFRHWSGSVSAGLFQSHDANSRDGLFGEAQTLLAAHKYEEAVMVLQTLIKRYPHDVVSYRIMLDVLCRDLGDVDRAEKIFRLALRSVKDKDVQQRLFAVFREASRVKTVELQGK